MTEPYDESTDSDAVRGGAAPRDVSVDPIYVGDNHATATGYAAPAVPSPRTGLDPTARYADIAGPAPVEDALDPVPGHAVTADGGE